MDCGKARKILYGADRLGPASPEVVKAQGHRQGCPGCQAFFADEEALAGFLRERSPRIAAPPHLREKVLEEIAKTRAPSRVPVASTVVRARVPRRVRAALLVLVMTGLALLAGITGYQGLTRSWQERIVAALIEDHVRFRPGAYEIASSRADQVEAWFSGKVDFAVQAPRFDQAELLGGRLCYLSGKKGALLSYRAHGALLSFYILDGAGVSLDRYKRRDLRDNTFGLGGGKGQNLILWKDRGLAYALVSDLPEEELVRMVLAMKPKAG